MSSFIKQLNSRVNLYEDLRLECIHKLNEIGIDISPNAGSKDIQKYFENQLRILQKGKEKLQNFITRRFMQMNNTEPNDLERLERDYLAAKAQETSLKKSVDRINEQIRSYEEIRSYALKKLKEDGFEINDNMSYEDIKNLVAKAIESFQNELNNLAKEIERVSGILNKVKEQK